MTVRGALAQESSRLKNAGIATASLDASILLGSILNYNRADIIAAGEDALDENILEVFCSLVNRRLSGECTAYITGSKEFRWLDFLVNPAVLVPRPDTEILVETAIDLLGNGEWGVGNGRVLDLCTGSGAIAIALKNEMSKLEVHAADISTEALEVAKKNALRLLGENKINFFCGDLYEALPHSPLPTPYSLITSNPPYIPSCELSSLPAEVQREPRLALDGGTEGLQIIERIINEAPDYLQKNGFLLLEADPRQMKKISFLLEKRGFGEIIIAKDLSGQQRVIGGRYV